jgi:hypothetical protein
MKLDKFSLNKFFKNLKFLRVQILKMFRKGKKVFLVIFFIFFLGLIIFFSHYFISQVSFCSSEQERTVLTGIFGLAFIIVGVSLISKIPVGETTLFPLAAKKASMYVLKLPTLMSKPLIIFSKTVVGQKGIFILSYCVAKVKLGFCFGGVPLLISNWIFGSVNFGKTPVLGVGTIAIIIMQILPEMKDFLGSLSFSDFWKPTPPSTRFNVPFEREEVSVGVSLLEDLLENLVNSTMKTNLQFLYGKRAVLFSSWLQQKEFLGSLEKKYLNKETLIKLDLKDYKYWLNPVQNSDRLFQKLVDDPDFPKMDLFRVLYGHNLILQITTLNNFILLNQEEIEVFIQFRSHYVKYHKYLQSLADKTGIDLKNLPTDKKLIRELSSLYPTKESFTIKRHLQYTSIPSFQKWMIQLNIIKPYLRLQDLSCSPLQYLIKNFEYWDDLSKNLEKVLSKKN